MRGWKRESRQSDGGWRRRRQGVGAVQGRNFARAPLHPPRLPPPLPLLLLLLDAEGSWTARVRCQFCARPLPWRCQPTRDLLQGVCRSLVRLTRLFSRVPPLRFFFLFSLAHCFGRTRGTRPVTRARLSSARRKTCSVHPFNWHVTRFTSTIMFAGMSTGNNVREHVSIAIVHIIWLFSCFPPSDFGSFSSARRGQWTWIHFWFSVIFCLLPWMLYLSPREKRTQTNDARDKMYSTRWNYTRLSWFHFVEFRAWSARYQRYVNVSDNRVADLCARGAVRLGPTNRNRCYRDHLIIYLHIRRWSMSPASDDSISLPSLFPLVTI